MKQKKQEQPEIAEWAKNTEPMSPEEQEEERLAWDRHRHRQRTQLERMRLSPGSPSLAEDRPKWRAARMSILAANYMPPEEEGQ
jgi:hypothetical protein